MAGRWRCIFGLLLLQQSWKTALSFPTTSIGASVVAGGSLAVNLRQISAFRVRGASKVELTASPSNVVSPLSSSRGIHARRGQSLEASPSDASSMSSDPWKRVSKLIDKNFFLVAMFFVVGFARVFPSLGKNGSLLKPELFLGSYGVSLIFLLSGLSLELSQLAQAASNVKLNFLVQLFIFGAWPYLIGVPLTTSLKQIFPMAFPQELLDGFLILTCLPTTINMCVILTSTSGGNVAAALTNAVLSNMAGIALTPTLLFRFFGSSISLPFGAMLLKLSKKVLLPVAVGQILRRTKAKDIYESNSKKLKRLQEYILLGIMWNAFCTAFSKNLGLQFPQFLALLVVLPLLHATVLGVLFVLCGGALSFPRGDVIAAMFCASQKTLAFGLPLIQTIFQGNPNLAMYCAPLMMIHPFQLIVGSMIIPTMQKYAAAKQEQ